MNGERERGQMPKLNSGLWAFSSKENYGLGSSCKFMAEEADFFVVVENLNLDSCQIYL